MNRYANKSASRLALTSCAAILTTLPFIGNTQTDAGKGYVVPRTADGQPDLQGIWSNAVLTPFERPVEFADKAFLTAEEAAEYQQRRREETFMDARQEDAETDVANAYNDFWWDWGEEIASTFRTSLVIDPPNGRVPELTAAGKQRAEELAAYRALHPADGPEDRTLQDRCLVWRSAGPPMVPTAYNNNFHLVQTADHVLIVNEMIHDARIIPLDGRPRLPDSVDQWLGSSVGYWEGDTLVVETTNFTDQTRFRGASEDMHLTERFTRASDDVLLYEFTVDDPSTFTQPWTVQIPATKADGLIYEYACHEGNVAMTGILAGARAEEAAGQR